MTETRGESLLFLSPRFLFPVDSGGKIRTTQILRALKGGRFRIRLASPGTRSLAEQYGRELAEVCDLFDWWAPRPDGIRRVLTRAWHLLSDLPMPVRIDLSSEAATFVSRAVADQPSVAVFDFLHSAVLAPDPFVCPSVLFTHNVETEIFARHRDVAGNPVAKAVWENQYRKMRRFEKLALRKFDVVVAVSERDARRFASEFSATDIHVIPTAVDLEYFYFTEPSRDRDIVFCGSMDWLANRDGINYFLREIWSRIVHQVPDAHFTVVGRAPPASLVAEAAKRRLQWTFTGYVSDVRPIVQGAAVSVVPIRIGGGTRLKIYESMAMGPVVISTSIGAEGLPIQSGRHCLIADDPCEFAAAVVLLLQDGARRATMAREARRFVEGNCSHRVAACAFEGACIAAIRRYQNANRDDARTSDRSRPW